MPVQSIFALLISLIASVIGAICGIGGGVIIKPALDLFGFADASTVSFLSACTVLSMSCYSVVRMLCKREAVIDLNLSTPLAIGAVLGGVGGNLLFGLIRASFADPDTVAVPQSICLAVVTAAALVCTLFKDKLPVLHVRSKAVCLAVGLALGLISVFLGIGGGPINIIVLLFFFGMETKRAAANSLYVILFSQLANLITTLVSGSTPELEGSTLILMIAGGLMGGILGRAINKRVSEKYVDRAFIAVMALIILISAYNAVSRAFI